MKKRMVSVTLCLVMLLSAALGIGCSSTGTVDTTEAPRESQEAIGGQPVSEPALDVKSTPDVSKMRIVSFDDVADKVTIFAEYVFMSANFDGIWVKNQAEQDVIEDPTWGRDVLFAVNLNFRVPTDKDESLKELEPLKEYLIRLNEQLRAEGYIIDWNIVDSKIPEMPYKVCFTGLLTAEQILIMPEKFHTLVFDFAFGRINENKEVLVWSNYGLETSDEVIASGKDVTEAEIKAACSKQSPADYDCLPGYLSASPIPSIEEVPKVEYDLEGKRILTASDFISQGREWTSDKQLHTTLLAFVDDKTREYVLAEENEDALFAVQIYVYYGIERNEAAARYHAMSMAKTYAEYGCTLNWAVVKIEGREGYYPFLYGYVSSEQLHALSGYSALGYDFSMLALANVDANGNLIIDLMEGATIVNEAK